MEEMRLKVPDMSCGHCIGAIQRAMEVLDGVTEVEASLETKIVNIKSDRVLDTEEVLAAVAGAGYTPELVR
ncbi:MAG: heavy-metal-associated domain-containing protein [Longimicrobiales bacterium]